MRADSAEMSWDKSRSQWLLRIKIGDEVIRRHCKVAQSADDQKLRTIAQETVRDEGYEIDGGNVTVLR
jgi:hypothetical protein